MIKSFDISLDTKKETVNQIYNIKSNDFNVVKFNVTVAESRIPKSLIEATAVRLAIKKPDNKTVFLDGTITDATNGKMTFTLTTQSLIVPGKHTAEVIIYKDVEETFVTDDFTYIVSKGIVNDKTVESLNEWPILNKMISDTDIARQATITATTNANTQATYAKTQGDYAKDKCDYIVSKEADINYFTDETTNVQTQLNNIIIKSGTSDAETIQARGSFPLLNDRLNDVTVKLADILKNQAVVDIKKFGIVSGDFGHKPPYSKTEYDIAYNNMEGFKSALSYYSSLGVTSLAFPNGWYPMCYRNHLGGTWQTNIGWEIILPSNMDIDLGGSVVKVIFDSLNKNPYDLSTLKPYELMGKVFVFDKTENTTIKNGILVGDRYDRAYNSETTSPAGFANEQGQEQTYGVFIRNGSLNGNVIDLKICGFMGDGVGSIGGSNPNKGTDIISPIFYPGYVHTDGTLKTDIAGAYSTNMLDVNTMKGRIMIATNIGWTRVPNFNHQTFDISFFDVNSVFISQESAEHLNEITMPVGTKFIRITIYGETAGQTSINNKVFRISTLQPSYFYFVRCSIFDCNRGGFSNLPHDTVLEDCNIFECGQGSKMGWVRFPDTTRYGINCEDTVSRKLTMRGGSISDVGNAILLSAKEAFITDVTIKNVDFYAVGLQYIGKLYFKYNSVLKATGLLSFTTLTSNPNYERTIILEGNVLNRCKIFTIGEDAKCFIRDNNNTVIASGGISANNVNNLSVRVPIQRKPEYILSYFTGAVKNSNINIEADRYSTSDITFDLNKNSLNNVFNLKDFYLKGNYKIYNSEINNGVVRNFLDTEDNIVYGSTIAPRLFSSEFYKNVNTTRKTKMTKTTLKDDNLTSAQFIEILKNPTPLSGTLLNDSYVFEDCTIEINKSGTLRLFNVSTIHSNVPYLNVDITFKNCKFINNTVNTIELTNVSSSYITKSIVGCSFVGAFGFTNS